MLSLLIFARRAAAIFARRAAAIFARRAAAIFARRAAAIFARRAAATINDAKMYANFPFHFTTVMSSTVSKGFIIGHWLVLCWLF
jgi:hypothetical protein